MRVVVAGVVFALALLASASSADAVTAASCNSTNALNHINEAIAATADGGTVTVPAGSCTWTRQVVLSGRNVTLAGAGSSSTLITAGVCGGQASLVWNTSGGTPRLTGFSFVNSCGNDGNSGGGMININGQTDNLRIDHNVFVQSGQARAVMMHGNGIFGVMDHNVCTFNTSQCIFLVHLYSYLGVGQYGDKSWSEPTNINSDDFFFIEDNDFTWGGPTQFCQVGFVWGSDQHSGARSWFRRNRMHNCANLSNHGAETGGRAVRSSRFFGLLQNTFDVPASAVTAGIISTRGGTGPVIDNRLTIGSGGFVNEFIGLVTYRGVTSETRTFYVFGASGQRSVSSLTCSAGVAIVTLTTARAGTCDDGNGGGAWITIAGASPAGFNGNWIAYTPGLGCGGTSTNSSRYTIPGGCPAASATGTITYTSPADQNATASGYRLFDGAGAGQGDYISGTFFTPTTWPNQAIEPIYIVNNLVNGSLQNAEHFRNASDTVQFENIQYYLDNSGCAAPSACTSGVGRGTLANRPTSCTSGAAYWVTNAGEWDSTDGEGTVFSHDNGASAPAGADGRLDICVAGAWSDGAITPYTYPHPLVSGSPPPNSSPSIAITSPAAFFNTTASTLNFSGTCTDDSGACSSVSRSNSNGGGTTPAPVLVGSNWTITAGEINSGTNTYTVTGSDGTLTGNSTASVLRRAVVSSLPYTEDCSSSVAWPSRGVHFTHYGSTQAAYGMTSGQCRTNVFAFDASAFTGFSLTTNQYFKVKVFDIAAVSKQLRLCVNVTGTTGQNNDLSGLFVQVEASGASANNLIGRYTNGALDHVYQSGINVGTITPGASFVEARRDGVFLYLVVDDVIKGTADVGSGFQGGTVADCSVGVGTAWDDGEIGNVDAGPDEDPPVPVIAVPTTDPGYFTEEATLATLSGAVTDNVGVVSCTYESNQGQGQVAMTLDMGDFSASDVPLVVGVNVITVRCFDASVLTGVDILTVTRGNEGQGGPQSPSALRGIF